MGHDIPPITTQELTTQGRISPGIDTNSTGIYTSSGHGGKIIIKAFINI